MKKAAYGAFTGSSRTHDAKVQLNFNMTIRGRNELTQQSYLVEKQVGDAWVTEA
jgi:hypothetical protein